MMEYPIVLGTAEEENAEHEAEHQRYLKNGSEARPLSDGSPIKFEGGYSLEFDHKGHHRIVDPSGKGGFWNWYEGPCVSHDGAHISFTDYFNGEGYPVNTILKLTPLNPL